MEQTLAALRRYAALIAPMIQGARSPFTPAAESASAVQVERGIIFADAMVHADLPQRSSIERLIELSTSPRLGSIAVVDRTGHHRPVYRGLMIYSWLQAF